MYRISFKPLLLAAALLIASLPGCTGKSSQADLTAFTRDVYTPTHASGFKIQGAEGMESTLITVSNPWQGADSVATYLFVARNGEEAPAGVQTMEVPDGRLPRIIAMSSTNVAMLDALGAIESVVGVSGIDYIANESIQARRTEVADVGYEGSVNYELVAQLNPDLVLLFGVNGASPMEGKLEELGIPYMYVGDYLEESPLGKAEWMVAVSEVIGRRERGEELFSEIPQRYNALKERVAQAGEPEPKVMFNTPYGDTWFMPSNQSYSVQLINDAGACLVYDKNTGNTSMPIDMEEAYLLTENSDYWLNVGMARTLDDVAGMCPKFTDTRVFTDRRVYNNNLRTNAAGGNDYYESAVVHPDLVLRDLVKIFHPSLLPDSTEFVYYKRL